MRYQDYENKIARIGAVLSKVVKHRRWVIAGLALFGALVIGLLAAKGTPGAVTCQAEVVYGDSFSCHASVFLGKTRYQYRLEDGQWSGEAPYQPGNYQIRAVGRTVFGTYRYGEAAEFTLLAREIQVTVWEDTLAFEETPTAYCADLTEGDTLLCDSFLSGPIASGYRPYQSNQEILTPDESAIRILRADGTDVTAAYDIETVSQLVTYELRQATLTTASGSWVYDNQEHFCQDHLLEGLAEGHTYTVLSYATIQDAGECENNMTVHIFNAQGKDVTYTYDLACVFGTLTVTRRPVTVTTDSQSWVYDGKAHYCTTYTITDLAGGHRTVCSSYMLTSSIFYSWLIPTDSDQDITEDAISLPSCIQNVGQMENKFTICIIDGSRHLIVNANYDITYVYGTLTVTERPITVTTGSETWVYDGQPHECYDLTVSNLAAGHDTVVGGSEEITTSSYLELPPSITDAGVCKNEFQIHIIDSDGEVVTDNYKITYVYGTLTVTKRPITVTTGSETWVYDGQNHYCEDFSVDDLAEGHTGSVAILYGGSSVPVLLNVGTRENVFRVTISDSDGNVVSDNYTISYIYGTLTVTPRPITVTAYAEKYYDGTPLSGGTPCTAEASPYPVADGQELSATVRGSGTDIGTYASTLSNVKVAEKGQDVTSNYDISIEEGQIVIMPRIISIVTASDQKAYDGTPLTNDLYAWAGESGSPALLEGHQLVVEVTGSITDPGTAPNMFSAKVVDARGADVSRYYEFLCTAGTLTVTEAVINDPMENIIYITLARLEKYYDGTPLTYEEGDYWISGLPEGATLEVDISISLTEPGSITLGRLNSALPTFRLYVDGVDVSWSYTLRFRTTEGDGDSNVVTAVLPRVLELTSVSESKYDDGTALTNGEVRISYGSLAPGHTLVATASGSIYEVGETSNTLSRNDVHIYDENGNDVTAHYDLRLVEGTLTILPDSE